MNSELNSSSISQSGGHVQCIMESNSVQGCFIQEQVTVHTREPSDTLEIRLVVLPANKISLGFLVCPGLKYLNAQ